MTEAPDPAFIAPYATSARAYLTAGWEPLYLPERAKTPPPPGYTGRDGRRVGAQDVERWVRDHPRGNVGLRMPVFRALSIDIDAYHGGLETLIKLEESYGQLPATWSSTSRDDGSRQQFYRLPGYQAVELPGKLGPGIEVIQAHHRYAVVWPSIHPETGRSYEWSRPDGAVVRDEAVIVPTVDDLTLLPETWTNVRGVTTGYPGGHRAGERFTDEIVDSIITGGVDANGNQDDDLSQLVFHLVRRGLSDQVIRTLWNTAVSHTVFREVPGKPFGFGDADFDRHLSGARGKLGDGLTTQQVEWAHNLAQVPVLAHVVELDDGDVGDDDRGDHGEGDEGGGDRGDDVGVVADNAGRPTIPNPNQPTRVARWLERRWRHPETVKIGHWQGAWRVWNGTHWAEVSDQEMRHGIYALLEHRQYLALDDGVWAPRDWNPDTTKINKVLDAFTAQRFIGDDVVAGDWLVDDGPRGLIPLTNGLFDPVGRQLHTHTPRHFNLHALPFDYDREATCPVWETYLVGILDPETVALLQEWAGYLVSGRTDLQKMMFLIGPKRSGKGTFAYVMSQLLGDVNVAGPTMSSFVGEFGLSPFIGRPLAVFDDVRIGARMDVTLAIERLLSITGEGRLSINRKNRDWWNGILITRLMMMSNEVPRFIDASNALSDRMLIARYTQSFLGQEDPELRHSFDGELSGILNWALDGLSRLNENGGKFTVPAASALVREELEDEGNQVLPFLRERCVLDPAASVSVDDLMIEWCLWRGGKVQDTPGQRTSLGKLIHAVHPEVERTKRMIDGVRSYHYLGLGLIGPGGGLAQWARQPGGIAGLNRDA